MSYASNKPPEFPWKKGVNPDYTAATVEVHLCETPQGLFVQHNLPPEDLNICNQMTNLGYQQVAYALLLSAFRAELLVDAMVLQTKEGFVYKYKKASPEERLTMEQELADAGAAMVSKMLVKLMPVTAKETLHMLTEQE